MQPVKTRGSQKPGLCPTAHQGSMELGFRDSGFRGLGDNAKLVATVSVMVLLLVQGLELKM